MPYTLYKRLGKAPKTGLVTVVKKRVSVQCEDRTARPSHSVVTMYTELPRSATKIFVNYDSVRITEHFSYYLNNSVICYCVHLRS
jgi:hypothetical protein